MHETTLCYILSVNSKVQLLFHVQSYGCKNSLYILCLIVFRGMLSFPVITSFLIVLNFFQYFLFLKSNPKKCCLHHFFSLSQNLVIFACLVVRLRKFIVCVYFIFSKYNSEISTGFSFLTCQYSKKIFSDWILEGIKNLEING